MFNHLSDDSAACNLQCILLQVQPRCKCGVKSHLASLHSGEKNTTLNPGRYKFAPLAGCFLNGNRSNPARPFFILGHGIIDDNDSTIDKFCYQLNLTFLISNRCVHNIQGNHSLILFGSICSFKYFKSVLLSNPD